MATLFQVPTQNNLQYTLNGSIAQGASSLTLSSSVVGIVQAPGVCVVDRVDASGNKTPTSREYISFTGVSGSSLTGLTKGLAGSTDQAHNVGAIVEFVPDVTQEIAKYQFLTTEHSINGVHVSLPSLTLVTTQQLNAVGINVTGNLNASGASLQGFPLRPVWYLPGTLSGASTSAGSPLVMTDPAKIQWVSVTLQQPASAASLQFNVNKNFANIFSGAQLTIPLNGTYVSTASIATMTFNTGDVFSVDVITNNSLGGGANIQFYAR